MFDTMANQNKQMVDKWTFAYHLSDTEQNLDDPSNRRFFHKGLVLVFLMMGDKQNHH